MADQSTTQGTTEAPATPTESASPAPSGEPAAPEENIDDEEAAFYERLYRYHQKPVKPAKVPLPDLPESKMNLLRDHVRVINGRTPKYRHKARIPCWMDSPEFVPKLNRTFKERGRFVRSKLEDRKDSEEDVYSSRCLL